MNFALISFPGEDDSLGVIPTNWITSSGRSCYYPCVISDFTKNKLISTRHEPGNDWVEVEMKIIRKFETYKTAKSHLMDAETAYPGVTDGNSESKTRSRRVSKRPRKKKKIVLPGESSSSDDEIHIKKKFVNRPNSPHPSISSTDYEFTQLSTTNTHLSLQTSPEPADVVKESLLKLPRCTVELSPTLKNHTVQIPPEFMNDDEQTPPTPTSSTVETPPTLTNHNVHTPSTLTNNAVQSPPTLLNSSALINSSVQTSPTLTNHTVQTPSTLANNTVESPPTLLNSSVQTSPTLTNHTVQTPSTLANNTVESPPTLLNSSVQTSPTLTNHTVQTPSTLANNTVESPPTLLNSSVQTSPTLTNHTVQTPSTLANNTVESPPTLLNSSVQTSPTLTNHTVQTPSTLANNTVESPPTLLNSSVQTSPTLTNHTVQTPSTLANNTVESPPTLLNSSVQTSPTLTNHTVQTPSTLANNTVESPPTLLNSSVQTSPTLTNHTVQSPTTHTPFLEPSTPTALHSDSPIINKSPTINQKTHKPKFKGLLRPVSPSSCGSTPLPLSQPIRVNVNTRSRSVEEASASSPLSSPGSSSSSTSIKSEILSLRQNQEMMWVVLGEISQKLDSIMGTVARLENRSDVVLVPESNIEDCENGWIQEDGFFTANFPLNNRTVFCEFEEKLLDTTFRHKILRFFNDRSGNTIRNLVASIMRKLITDEVAEEYSLTGKSGTKKAFDNTKSFCVVCQICYRKFVGGEEREIREGVSDWLMQAKFRRLRRLKRSGGMNETREQSITFTELNM